MMFMSFLKSRPDSFDVPCTLDIEHTAESLHAHVELEGGVQIEPGDKVKVHGEAIDVPFGERRTFRRTATVTRAGWTDRLWIRLTSRLELTELYDVSFTSGRKL